jgi:hypothetical protein
MFESNVFEKWLDDKSKELVTKIGNQESLTSEEMIILVLKAQSNHFHHLDEDMRKDMHDLREDMQNDIKTLRQDMQDRFEQVDKRFEQVDKRFEQIDKRFDAVILRMDKFMLWSLGVTMTSTFLILGFMYKLVN